MSLLGGTANKRCLLEFDMEGTWRKCSKCLLEFPLFCLAGMAVLQGDIQAFALNARKRPD